jgi:hypothetical protein
MSPTQLPTPESSTTGSSPSAKPSAVLAAASAAIARRATSVRRSPAPTLSLAPLSLAAAPSSDAAAPPLSSRSADSSGGVTGYAKGKHALYFLRERTRNTVCLGRVKDASGRTYRACNDTACNILGHMDSASKFEGLGDAYYAPAKKNSFVMWPFVLLEDLKRTEEMGLVTPMRSTAEHVEEIHRFYDRHPDVFRELMARPDMAALAFVPTVSSVPIEARRRGFDEFNSGASVTSAPARTSPVRQLANQDFQDNDSVEIRSATRGVKSSGSVKVEGTISPLLTPRPLTNDDDRSSSDSSSINSRISSWSEIDQHMAPFRELLPIKSSFAPDPSLSTSDEPWAVAHAQISSAVVNLSDKVDALARLTTEAVEEDRLSGARSSKMIRKLKTAHLALTRDIMGTLNRAETIDDCGPLWEYVKEVAGWYSTLSASLEDCLVKTEEAATTAHAATSASQDVSEEMNLIASETAKGLVATSEEVAAYFDQVKERVDVLEGKVNRLAVPA